MCGLAFKDTYNPLVEGIFELSCYRLRTEITRQQSRKLAPSSCKVTNRALVTRTRFFGGRCSLVLDRSVPRHADEIKLSSPRSGVNPSDFSRNKFGFYYNGVRCSFALGSLHGDHRRVTMQTATHAAKLRLSKDGCCERAHNDVVCSSQWGSEVSLCLFCAPT